MSLNDLLLVFLPRLNQNGPKCQQERAHARKAYTLHPKSQTPIELRLELYTLKLKPGKSRRGSFGQCSDPRKVREWCNIGAGIITISYYFVEFLVRILVLV